MFGRYCSTKKEKEQCRVTDTGGGQRMEDCYCNTDLCNVAMATKHDKFHLNLTLLLLMLLFVL